MIAKRRRHALSDRQWGLVAAMLPTKSTNGRPPRDPRDMLEGMLWIMRTGAPWRDLPEWFGPWQTVYHYLNEWPRDGVLEPRHHDALRNRGWRTLRGLLDLRFDAHGDHQGRQHDAKHAQSSVSAADRRRPSRGTAVSFRNSPRDSSAHSGVQRGSHAVLRGRSPTRQFCPENRAFFK